MVTIGNPVTVVEGYNVTINCDVLTGSPPINTSWYRNGVLHPIKDVASITITPVDGENITCRTGNHEKFTIITVQAAGMYIFLIKSFHCTASCSYSLYVLHTLYVCSYVHTYCKLCTHVIY